MCATCGEIAPGGEAKFFRDFNAADASLEFLPPGPAIKELAEGVCICADMKSAWRGLDSRIRRYYSFLLNDVPQELVRVLRQRLADREAPEEAPKIERLRPGQPPHVRIPNPPG